MARQSPAALRAAAQEAATSLQQLLRQIGQATCQVNLVKSTATPTQRNTRHLAMNDALMTQFKERAGTSLGTVLGGIAEHGIGDFNFDALAGGRVGAFGVDQFPPVTGWLATLPADEAVIALTPQDEHMRLLQFTNVILTFRNGERIQLFHKASDARAITRQTGVVIHWTGDRYAPLDPATTFILETDIHFFVWRELVYVVNYRKFESILDFREVTKNIAGQSFDLFVAALPVTNPQALREALLRGARHPNKLAAIYRAPHIGQLSMNRIRAVIQNRGLPIAVILVGDVETLQIDHTNRDHIVAYLHVLSDDYVQSQLTDRPYIAIEKTD